MSSIWEDTKTALDNLAPVPAAANALIVASEAERPDLYIVYQLISAPPEQHADDRETMRSYKVQVSVYNRAGLANLPNVAGAMTAAGFTRGAIRELPYNESTRHYGLAYEFTLLKNEE